MSAHSSMEYPNVPPAGSRASSSTKSPGKPDEIQTAVLTVNDTPDIPDTPPNKAHDLEKNGFSMFSAVSLGVCVINSWVTLLVALGAGLTSGGPTASRSEPYRS